MPGTVFLLTDIAGEHLWTGTDFLAMSAWEKDLDGLAWFRTRARAEAEVVRLRQEEDIHLRIVSWPDSATQGNGTPR